MAIDIELPFVPASIISPRQLGQLIAQVTISEESIDELDITDHPVETGSTITDHAFKKPPQVTIRAGWSNSQLYPNANLTYVQNVYDTLIAIQNSRLPFVIVTGKRVYQNMLFASLITMTDKNSESALYVTCRARQINLVQTQIVSISDNSVQADPSKTGSIIQLGQQNLNPTSAVNVPALPPLF